MGDSPLTPMIDLHLIYWNRLALAFKSQHRALML